jgi:hypothetical protein
VAGPTHVSEDEFFRRGFARVVPDPALAGLPAAVFSGTAGGWGIFVWPPTAEVRVEAASNLTATTSFCLVEIPKTG